MVYMRYYINCCYTLTKTKNARTDEISPSNHPIHDASSDFNEEQQHMIATKHVNAARYDNHHIRLFATQVPAASNIAVAHLLPLCCVVEEELSKAAHLSFFIHLLFKQLCICGSRHFVAAADDSSTQLLWRCRGPEEEIHAERDTSLAGASKSGFGA